MRCSGRASVEIVAAVATLEPLVAENRADAPMLAFINPPGSHDTHLDTAPYIWPATPELTSSSPINTYSGMATRRNSELEPHASSPMAFTSDSGE
ncbi:hypothetical protein D3C72_1674270 [compost metagenome]